MYAPPLAPEVRALADELAFPLLATAYEVPFNAVVKTVARPIAARSTRVCSTR